MNEFFAMGGYAIYVWPSYGLFFLLLIGNWGTAWRRDRRIRRRILAEREAP